MHLEIDLKEAGYGSLGTYHQIQQRYHLSILLINIRFITKKEPLLFRAEELIPNQNDRVVDTGHIQDFWDGRWPVQNKSWLDGQLAIRSLAEHP